MQIWEWLALVVRGMWRVPCGLSHRETLPRAGVLDLCWSHGQFRTAGDVGLLTEDDWGSHTPCCRAKVEAYSWNCEEKKKLLLSTCLDLFVSKHVSSVAIAKSKWYFPASHHSLLWHPKSVSLMPQRTVLPEGPEYTIPYVLNLLHASNRVTASKRYHIKSAVSIPTIDIMFL